MLAIVKILKAWKAEAKVKEPILYTINYKTENDGSILNLYTCHPGALIGKGGETYNKYKAAIQQQYPYISGINFVDTHGYIY